MKLTKPAAKAAKTVVSMPSPKAFEVVVDALELGVAHARRSARERGLAPAPARDEQREERGQDDDRDDRHELRREACAVVLGHREDVLAVLADEPGLDLLLREALRDVAADEPALRVGLRR